MGLSYRRISNKMKFLYGIHTAISVIHELGEEVFFKDKDISREEREDIDNS